MKFISFICFFFTVFTAGAQLSFIPNQNQWSDDVLYRADIPGGSAFFGEKKITYAYYSSEDLQRAHELTAHNEDSLAVIGETDYAVRCFAFEVNFVNAQPAFVKPGDRKQHNVNYFIGNDPSKWAQNVPVYETLEYDEIYPGIDIQYYSSGNQLKYDFIAEPGSDPAQIVMQYNGQRSIRMQGENLVIDLGFTTITEIIPVAYQVRNGVRQAVNCKFSLLNNQVRFEFPEGYDHTLQLVIDPVVLASTYSGATGVAGGFSATYDEQGNIYTGGDAFGTGMPVTLGAYNASFSGATDLVISKFNADGSTLLYCTYIGGGGMEFPQNMCERDGKLWIMGATFSADFPVFVQSFDTTLDGTCDIYVCCLDNTGSNLLGSTYVGGNWGDGTSLLTPFYPDRLRGDVCIAENGDVLVCSSTLSTNFPATPGAFRTTTFGGQDAVVFRMNSTLNTMIWATYLGSGVSDVALDIMEAKDGTIFVCGGTNNMLGAFPTTPGAYRTAGMGGADAFVVHFNAAGSGMIASTLYGGTGLDVAYYMDIDKDGDIYICGLSKTPLITDGVYYCPGATNFIAKLNASLTELMFSTVIGSSVPNQMTVSSPASTSNPPVMIGPNPIRAGDNAVTAFMVDECERMYIAAYTGNSVWPLTADALYQYSPDNKFCVAVLEENASTLLTSTMYSGIHVDGGSGHFDDNGILYQASCVEMGSIFQTVPWAWSNGSSAGFYDIAVFKINMRIDLVDSIILPNVFTPNNDGINDNFHLGEVTTNFYDLNIYDRNGTRVFSSTDPHTPWDGTYNGKDCSEGVYYYAVRYYFCTEMREKSGFVHLTR